MPGQHGGDARSKPRPHAHRRLQPPVGVEGDHAVQHRLEARKHSLQEAAELANLLVLGPRCQRGEEHRKHGILGGQGRR